MTGILPVFFGEAFLSTAEKKTALSLGHSSLAPPPFLFLLKLADSSASNSNIALLLGISSYPPYPPAPGAYDGSTSNDGGGGGGGGGDIGVGSKSKGGGWKTL